MIDQHDMIVSFEFSLNNFFAEHLFDKRKKNVIYIKLQTILFVNVNLDEHQFLHIKVITH